MTSGHREIPSAAARLVALLFAALGVLSGRAFPAPARPGLAGGTGDLAEAAGELVLDGWFGLGASTAFGTVSGSLTLPDRTPESADDCTDGGWRDLVDDQGDPFPNQGLCVA